MPNNQLNNEFTGYVSYDSSPRNSACEWCEKPAVQRCIVTGGKFHNQGGLFCATHREEYADHIEHASQSGEAGADHIEHASQDEEHVKHLEHASQSGRVRANHLEYTDHIEHVSQNGRARADHIEHANHLEHAYQNGRARAEQTSLGSYHWKSGPLSIIACSEQPVYDKYLFPEDEGGNIDTIEDHQRWVGGTFAQ